MWQKMSKCYPPSFELIPLLLVFLGVYLVANSYPSLPDTIPTHFDLQGVPDEWDSKRDLFVFPIMGAGIYILMTVIGMLVAAGKDPRRFINLPLNRKANLSEAQMEELRIFMVRSLLALKFAMESLFTYSVYISIEVAKGRASGLGPPWFIFLAMIMGVAAYMTWRSWRITAIPKQS